MAGKILPPLVGIKVKEKYVAKGHPLVVRLRKPEYTTLFDSGDVVPPVIVFYAHGDKKVCGDIYNKEILEKFCANRQSKLTPGEYVLVLIDGVPHHLSRYVACGVYVSTPYSCMCV